MESMRVKSVFAFLVSLNGILIGVQADNSPDWIGWDYAEIVFIALFSIELGFKLLAYQWMFWKDTWNVIDFAIVVVSLAELILSVTINYTSSGISAFRLIRILRVIRVISYVEQLTLLVEAFAR